MTRDEIIRVIAQQQKEIDRLKAVVASSNKQLNKRFESDERLFELIATLLNFQLRQHWKEDHKEAFAEYNRIHHEIMMALLADGFCLSCQSFVCECEHDH